MPPFSTWCYFQLCLPFSKINTNQLTIAKSFLRFMSVSNLLFSVLTAALVNWDKLGRTIQHLSTRIKLTKPFFKKTISVFVTITVCHFFLIEGKISKISEQIKNATRNDKLRTRLPIGITHLTLPMLFSFLHYLPLFQIFYLLLSLRLQI